MTIFLLFDFGLLMKLIFTPRNFKQNLNRRFLTALKIMFCYEKVVCNSNCIRKNIIVAASQIGTRKAPCANLVATFLIGVFIKGFLLVFGSENF